MTSIRAMRVLAAAEILRATVQCREPTQPLRRLLKESGSLESREIIKDASG
jgi:hypothetical protein